MKTKLTETLVKNLSRNSVVWDAEITGLGIRRQRRDRIFVLRRNGRQVALGEWPVLSVKDARDAAIDRLRVRIAGNAARFSDVAEKYLAAGQWRRRCEIERHLKEDCLAFASLRLSSIDRQKISALLGEIEKRGGATRNRVRASLSALWTYAIAEGLAENNPVTGTRKAEERSRDRVLTQAEIRTLWHGLPPGRYGDIVRLLLLTAQRRSEIAELRASEIILDEEPRIVLSADRTKSDRPHVVPLAPQAIAILKPYLRAGDDLIFKNGIAFSRHKAELDATLRLKPWRHHDLRRGAASGMAEWLGIAPHIIEAILNHSRQGVAGTYNRSTYPKEAREALTRWADYVDGLV
jgi:integrase